VRGLRYALSALGHHWTFVAGPAGGLASPLTAPLSVNTYPAWVALDQLPALPPGELP